MGLRRGCGPVLFGCLFVLVAVAVFAALAAALVLSGEVPLYGPRLTGFAPHPNETLLPTTPITFTFDQPMDPASFEAAFDLVPSVPGELQWNEDQTQVAFVPQSPGFEPGREYTVGLAPGIEAGTLPRTTELAHRWSYSLPPLIQSQAPAADEAELGAWTEIEVTLNYALDCSSTLRTFTIEPDAPGLLECREGFLAFTPTEPLAPGTAYVARLAHVFLEDDPTPRLGPAWSFTTAPPLEVRAISPAANEFLMNLWTPVRITFNRPVVPQTLLSRFSLAPTGGDAVPGASLWDEGGATFIFEPETPLQPDAQYRIFLGEGVRGWLGFGLDAPLEQTFTTLDMTGLPLPVPGSQDVSLDSQIRVPFNRPMDRASVEAGLTFTPTLRQAQGEPWNAELAWETDVGGEEILVLTPTGGLAADTAYEVRLSAEVRDATGAPLARTKGWSFETEPFLLRADVPEKSPLLTLQRSVAFAFALPMDRASVAAALVVEPETPGDLAWSEDGRTATFQPDPAWLPGAEYEITLGASARTADGVQSLGQARTWAFATGSAEVQFGEGPNVQVMDATGERAVQLTYRGADVAEFRLYPITPTQLLELYSSDFRGVGPGEAQFVSTANLTPTVAWRQVMTPLADGAYYDNWQPAEVALPDDVPIGTYVLATEALSETNGQLLVVLTEHTLVLKRALAGAGSRTRAQIVAWDTEIGTGSPVVSATVRLYDRDGTFLAEGLTDADGLLALDVAGDPGPLLALSEAGGDVALCGLSNEWNESGWWWWWTEPASRPLYRTYSYTDRPIYRPGQTVYFKDWLRAADDVSYTLPISPTSPPLAGGAEGGQLSVTVRLRDARDNVAVTQVLTPTEFGTVHGQFRLADEPMLGTWHLETEVEGTLTRQPLKVEEYRKPEYEVAVSTPQRAYVAGELVSVTVEAAYYFGQPVAGADVEFVVYPTYSDAYYLPEGDRFGYPLFSESGRTDDGGRWTLMLSTDEVFAHREEARRAMLALEATLTDDTGQSVSSYQTVVVQRTSQGLTLLLARHGYEPGEEVIVGARVLDRDGEPVPGVELTAQVLGWDDREVASAAGTTGQDGLAEFSFRLTEQGWYRLSVRGVDDGGRTMEAEEWLWVYDPSGQAPWYRGQWGQAQALSVSADRSTYAVGDEAQLIVYSPTPGPALLTFERGETHHARPVELVSGTNLITVPIRADYAPNIHVTVNQYGPLTEEDWWYEQSRPEGELHTASTQLLVPMTDRQLTVTLVAETETYAPGEEATFEVQVTDHEGQPVVAEVSLAVVDEAIYALAEDLSKDPFDVFYAPRPDIVETYDSLKPTRWLYPQRPGMGGADGEAAGAPRRTFLDTAYWAPAVVTDEAGQATVAFTLPDNLTEWRALARAVTTDTLVGQATARVVVSKDVVVRPALPRFLVQGDALTLTAVVHNFTTEPASATVGIGYFGLVVEDGADQVVHLPAGGSAQVGWPVVAGEPGEARITVRASAGVGARIVGRDAVEVSLPVRPLAVPEMATFAGQVTPQQPTDTFTVTLPPDAIEGLSRLEVNLAPTIAPGLLQGLEYLIDYPFG